MTLLWTEQSDPKQSGQPVYTTRVEGTTDSEIRSAINTCIDKAVALMPHSISDESMYLLFLWDSASAALAIGMTSDNKQLSNGLLVQCLMTGLQQKQLTQLVDNAPQNQSFKEEYSASIRYWISNYLTTCNAFMQFSLIAIFKDTAQQRDYLL